MDAPAFATPMHTAEPVSGPGGSASGDSAALAAAARPGHELPFVAPSHYLRPKSNSRTMAEKPKSQLDRDEAEGLVS
jgi:5'-AMP-activated protein kinase, regulatory gamma subunit